MKNRQQEEDLLTADIKELPVTENFYLRCRLMGFSSIGQIINTPVKSIFAKEDFSYSWMGELVRFLMSQNLLHKLQSLPGNSVY